MPGCEKVRVTVWSDYVCPFCYIEEPFISRLKEEYGDSLEIVWRAFELRPEPLPTLDPKGEYLRTVWERAVYPLARSREMYLRLPPLQPRSRAAHEAAFFARANGKFEQYNLALFRAFFERGENIGDKQVLLSLAVETGLSSVELAEALDTKRYVSEVVQDERLAERFEVKSVPTVHIGGAHESLDRAVAILGAQPYQNLKETVEEIFCGGSATMSCFTASL